MEDSELNAANIWGKVEVQFKVGRSGTKVAEPILIVNECQIGKLLLFLSLPAQVCVLPSASGWFLCQTPQWQGSSQLTGKQEDL